MPSRSYRFVNLRKVFGVRAQAVHASIDLEVHSALALRVSGRGLLQQFNVLARPDCRGELMLDDLPLFAAPETAQDQDALFDPGASQCEALLNAAHGKPFCSGFAQRPRTTQGSVAVGVTLDDRADRHLFPHMGLDRAQVMTQRAER